MKRMSATNHFHKGEHKPMLITDRQFEIEFLDLVV